MKLQFRAEKKDIMIFIVFNIFLLYFVALSVVNINSFATDATFSGLNPIPAFQGSLLAPTIVFYLLVLVTIIISVSSHFWERDKGIGIKTGKSAKDGYNRFATEKEMKSELKCVDPKAETIEYAGIPLIMNKKEMWVDDGSYHNLIIGATGTGKTQMSVLPMVKLLAKKGESMIITDPKGEIYKKTSDSLRNRGYNIVVLNFRDPQYGQAWNPLALPYQLFQSGDRDKAIELLEDLAVNILYDEEAANQDPFWERTSADYFVALALSLFKDATKEEVNLNSINLLSTLGEDKIKGTTNTYIKEYFSYKDPTSPEYISAASTINAPSDTKASILSVFKQKIKMFSTREVLAEMLAHNDIDMEEIGTKKTAVYIIIHDEKKTYHPLATIFLKQCYETLVSVATKNQDGQLRYRTNFILDEFANMPPLKDVTTMVTAARSRSIRFTFIIQNFAQLYQVYGKENGETIKGNCGNLVYINSTELSALEEISKRAGEIKSKDDAKTSSTPLITISDLQNIKQWEIIILRIRMQPFKTMLTPNFKIDWGEQEGDAEFVERDKREVLVFDFKKYVDDKRAEKMAQTPSPFGGLPNQPRTPFGGMPNPMFNNPMMGGANQPQFPFPNAQNPAPYPNTAPATPMIQPNANMDMDAMLKQLDAKIAELEAEEAREKELKKAEEAKKKEVVVEKTIIEEKIEVKEEIIVPEEPKEKVNPNIITDDQYFDDFFNDDE